MTYLSKNPATGEVLATIPEMTSADIERRLSVAQETFAAWRETPFAFRAERMKNIARILKKESRSFGELMTREMGKPIRQAVAEAEKCARVCEYYAENAEQFLRPESIASDASESFVRFDPLGIVLAVMPWNFPFWQVFRFAAPAVMAGNVGIVKHASNVPLCAQAIEDLFGRAGFPEGAFQNFFLSSSRIEGLIRDPRIVAVTLTGSEPAGRSVASIAGSEIKKTVLELGGSDPFIILADSDIESAIRVGVSARVQNAGQSCIAAKRFIVEKSIAKQFVSGFVRTFERLVVGDPMSEATDVGPLASEAILKDLERQVKESVDAGACVAIGGKRWIGSSLGYFFEPTILTDIAPAMPAYREELFGPVATVLIAEDAADAIRIANDTPFGLGASLWTSDIARAKELAQKIESGAVFVNAMVKSDPRVPFGGIKRSGYGRELGSFGIREFVNVKTVWLQ